MKRLTRFKNSIFNHRLRTLVALMLVFLGFGYWFIPPVWRLNEGPITVTQWIGTSDTREVVVGPHQDGWTDIDNVSEAVRRAIIASEDARFYQHQGLDFTEIENSISKNLKKGRLARGASTITQQVVKMAFLSREKSFVRKAREAVGALLLELILNKSGILEWYLNLAEFGKDIYGINAAARQYFQTTPDLLTIQQAIHLALVLPNPITWSAGLREKELTEFGNQRYKQIADHLKQSGYLTELQWLSVLATGNFGKPVDDYETIFIQFLLGQEDPEEADDTTLSQEAPQPPETIQPDQPIDNPPEDSAIQDESLIVPQKQSGEP